MRLFLWLFLWLFLCLLRYPCSFDPACSSVMTSPNAQIAVHLQSTPIYQRLPAHQRRERVTKISSFPPEWLQKPANGDRFESPQQCLERLNAYGFFEGCLFVTGKQRLDGTPSWELKCNFYGLQTSNKWHLEDQVIKDAEGVIMSNRKRDTHTKRKGCPMAYMVSFKIVNKEPQQHA
jgi:hypothetical protein